MKAYNYIYNVSVLILRGLMV